MVPRWDSQGGGADDFVSANNHIASCLSRLYEHSTLARKQTLEELGPLSVQGPTSRILKPMIPFKGPQTSGQWPQPQKAKPRTKPALIALPSIRNIPNAFSKPRKALPACLPACLPASSSGQRPQSKQRKMWAPSQDGDHQHPKLFAPSTFAKKP